MASKGDVKGFFRQTKKSGGITKPSSASSKAKSSQKSSTPKQAASLGSGTAQPPALISHGGSLDLQDDYEGSEEVLRQFDMNMAYGPCVGMTRIARWERASKLGMNPPSDVERLLRAGKVGGDSHSEVLDILKAKGEIFRFELKGVSMEIREAGIGRRGSSSKDSTISSST